MKALTHNIQQEREDQRDRSAQLFMWYIVVSMHQDDGIGASRLLRACLNLHSQKTAAELLPGVRPPVEENKKRRMKREWSHSGPMPEVWRENYLFGILPERTGLHNPKRRKSSETLCIQKRRTKRERSGL